jgi:hypothetical protein
MYPKAAQVKKPNDSAIMNSHHECSSSHQPERLGSPAIGQSSHLRRAALRATWVTRQTVILLFAKHLL